MITNKFFPIDKMRFADGYEKVIRNSSEKGMYCQSAVCRKILLEGDKKDCWDNDGFYVSYPVRASGLGKVNYTRFMFRCADCAINAMDRMHTACVVCSEFKFRQNDALELVRGNCACGRGNYMCSKCVAMLYFDDYFCPHCTVQTSK